MERTLDPLTASDFPLVAQLADRIWRSHYATIVPLAQIDYMLAGRYTPERLATYLDSGQRWMHVLRTGNEAVGYCSHALAEQPGEMKLEQLYLLPGLHGRGLGGYMLDRVEAHARSLGCTSLMLQVNKGNTSSIAVYRKRGFNVREAAVFDIGNGFVMDDYVMAKAL
ncbi:MAG TPA: GNAT family N-acetyltransferase [Holophagaceae bacterium]|nr:GNAT family N-acetyltransferase [Holophagaceae bacterium]